MTKLLKFSMFAILAVMPVVAGAAQTATKVNLVATNPNGNIPKTDIMATTSYVQGAYNALGTQINNIITDSTVPAAAESEPYQAVGPNYTVSENLIKLDRAITGVVGDSRFIYVTKADATVVPVPESTLNYLGSTTAGDKVGINFGILDKQIKANADAITALSGSSSDSVAAERDRATAAEEALGNRIGTVPAEDTHYIRADYNVSENLDVLDGRVFSNASHIGSLGSLRDTGTLAAESSRDSLVSAVNTLDAAIVTMRAQKVYAAGNWENEEESVEVNLF